MAARQLPPGRGAAAADPRGRAAQLLRAAAQAGRRAAGRPAAGLRHRLGLRGAHRQRAEQGAVHRLPECLPGHRRADPRRTVGAADHAAGGAAGEPAPGGREHRLEQGGARGRTCRVGPRGRARQPRPRHPLPRPAKPGHAGQLPHAAVATAAGGTWRRRAGALQVDRAALPQRTGADRRRADRAGGGQPHGRQHHHHLADDRPGRVGRPDRAGEPVAARAARAAQLRPRERTHPPADHAFDGAGRAQQPPAGTGGGAGSGAAGNGRRRAGARRARPGSPLVDGRLHRRLLPLRRRPAGADRGAGTGARRRRPAARGHPSQAAAQRATRPVPRRDRARHRLAAVRGGAWHDAHRLARAFVADGGSAGAAGLPAVGGGHCTGASHRRRIDPGAGAAAARLRPGHSAGAPGAGGDADPAGVARGQRAVGAPARTALAGEPRRPRAVRAADRLGRCGAGLDARRPRPARRRAGAHRGAQPALSGRRRAAPVPPAAPAAQLVPHRAPLDGLGAQARQARDAAAPAGRGRRQRLRARSRRRRARTVDRLRDDARQRHRPAAGRPARTGGGGGPSDERAADRPGQPPRGRRLRHLPAAHRHALPGAQRAFALPLDLRRPVRARSVQQQRLRHLPGRLRHRLLHRQGPAERAGGARDARPPPARRRGAQPRSARRHDRPLRGG